MATALLRSHDALANPMHLGAFAASPVKPRRRRHAKAASPPPVPSPAPRQQAAVASSPPKAGRRSPPAKPARKQASPTKETPKPPQMAIRILKRGEEPPAPSPAPAPAPSPAAAPVQAPPAVRRVRSPSPATSSPVAIRAQAPAADRRVRSPSPATTPAPTPARAQAPAADKRALGTTARIGPKEPSVVPTRKMVPAAATYAGPAFSVAAPEPSSLPLPGFFRRAEEEATRGLRCLLRIGELS
ncbi:unnamed protein product [Alopecurus aequalis]